MQELKSKNKCKRKRSEVVENGNHFWYFLVFWLVLVHGSISWRKRKRYPDCPFSTMLHYRKWYFEVNDISCYFIPTHLIFNLLSFGIAIWFFLVIPSKILYFCALFKVHVLWKLHRTLNIFLKFFTQFEAIVRLSILTVENIFQNHTGWQEIISKHFHTCLPLKIFRRKCLRNEFFQNAKLWHLMLWDLSEYMKMSDHTSKWRSITMIWKIRICIIYIDLI